MSRTTHEANPIELQVEQFIRQKFASPRIRYLNKSDDLLDGGIIDSIGVLELVGFLEKEFAVTVSDEDLTPENFRSIGAIARFVERSLQVQSRSA